MRTEVRVENVESMVRLAVEHISRLQAQMQASNGKRRSYALVSRVLTYISTTQKK
jgi:hypothetical protein